MVQKASYFFLALLALVVYEVYLIVYYRWQDYRIEAYIETLEVDNERLKAGIDAKRAHLTTVRTLAWVDKTIKKTQNRKNPGEQVIMLVADSSLTIAGSTGSVEKREATSGMSNPQKWIYYSIGSDMREW